VSEKSGKQRRDFARNSLHESDIYYSLESLLFKFKALAGFFAGEDPKQQEGKTLRNFACGSNKHEEPKA